MDIKKRLAILEKIAQTQGPETIEQTTAADQKAAEDLFDQLFEQVLQEELSKVR